MKGISLTEELGEIIGAFMGDGCLYKNKSHYNIQFTGHSELDIDYYTNIIIPNIEKIFNKKPQINFVKNKNAVRINYFSKEMFFFIKEFLDIKSTKNKTKTVKIPLFLLEKHNKIYLNSMIRGLFDTDGGIFLDSRKMYNKPYPRVLFYTISKKLHKQMSNYLSKHFNIYTYRRKYKSSNRSDSFSIEIYGHEQLWKWMEMIGFSNPRHLSKVALVAQPGRAQA